MALVGRARTPVRLTFTEDEVVLEAGTGEDAQASRARSPSRPSTARASSIALQPAVPASTACRRSGTTYVRLSFTQPSKPAVLVRPATAPTPRTTRGYRYLLMPVRMAG